jgi:hypothetical protein
MSSDPGTGSQESGAKVSKLALILVTRVSLLLAHDYRLPTPYLCTP